MTLIDEIRAKCSAALISSRDMGAITDAVNLKRTMHVHVPIADIQAYLQANGQWWIIKDAAADPLHVGHTPAAAIMDVANARYENIDIGLSFVGFVFSGLVSAGLLSQANIDAINEMGIRADPVMVQAVCRAMEGV